MSHTYNVMAHAGEVQVSSKELEDKTAELHQTIEDQNIAKEEVDALLDEEKKKSTILSGEVSVDIL